jgi:type IV pilus assembly protein PilA
MIEEKSRRSDLTCLFWVLGFFVFLGVGLLVALFAVAYENSRTFHCKSRQSEAKTHLSGIFTAERAFFGEYDSYSTDLVSVNWMPDGTPFYLYGFAAASTDHEAELRAVIPGYDPNRASTDHPAVIGTQPPLYSTARMASQGLTRALLPADATLTASSFTAAAVGNIDGDATLDIWTMNEEKHLTNVLNDCVQ